MNNKSAFAEPYRARAAASKIPFGRPAIVGNELGYIAEAIANGTIAGGGPFMQRCEKWLEQHLPARRALMTHSCTAALEMAAMLSGVGPGDEVIMPSFTFSATATAFVLRGATPVFVDIRRDTLNIDENLIEAAITPRTRAVVPVHYAGLACEMDTILAIAARHKLLVIEDAAQAHLSFYKGRALGTIGDLGCLSFHETKNIISGEGGALIVSNERFLERAEIIREKGTDRSRFFRGQVDKYTWQDIGSSYCPGEIVSAFLFAQLEHVEAICARRRALYDLYREHLQLLAKRGDIVIPEATGTDANGHIFWLLLKDEPTRAALIKHLAAYNINAVFHYIPLHSAPAGRKFGRTDGDLTVTDSVSNSLLRLPLYLELTDDDVHRIIDTISGFFGQKS
ncbi:TDP-4-oxo-6-deoxy-D-glucose transaminase [Bosea sp. 62]|uniref:dTDP-4-amino-4,6-dideoxygalactose transaminase n=1 Tax=unclassified Bosea (in: a-proteobacteria) TaxID=2653178 RepID=UPI00125A464D|nr:MULTISPECIES: dTDP-4-amino-4,6-dideoxygalactose transaminase [unclassified Bosea (in: a-proteobacteria)]CAD5293101.1 TDP-4-oxo-6-deoxy-D-glucose transaminase [Bosea sp. 21B]CAD5293654.1 TDP-4-oxo-6-deoxy-D-glucose transaminase [Bosea sp. 46]CAD5299478.1 TDP-4-oxo-6-deoxy-D-glucose transaminase [Bosea sp. 7B]VVT62201.1 TDP-4-oxo-6-deoxy-D-glucose transaminase [Bosea sp. EC-HK365B]VXB09687.1 TDP-4-oxo-6-deoxy-D-glucose transaminase [Bosea sp. 125]